MAEMTMASVMPTIIVEDKGLDWWQNLVQQAYEELLALDEAEISRMLGCWVSELEPAVVRDHEGRMLGLTAAEVLEGFVAPIPVRVTEEYSRREAQILGRR